MIKKQSPAWNIALVYYIFTNLLVFVPSNVLRVGMPYVITNPLIRGLVSLVLLLGITIFAIKISANNIMKQYLISDIRQIMAWSIAYLLFFNLVLLHLLLKMSLVVVLFAIIPVGLLYLIFTPRFLHVSTAVEIAETQSDPLKGKETSKQIGKGIFKAAGYTILAFVIVVIILFGALVILTK